jgi:Ca2+-binding RTX toxin-like protein
MSLFSRVGRRGRASAAVVFAGSLFVYLGATALPALAINPAVSSCDVNTTSSANDTLTVRIHADDTLALAYDVSGGPAGEFSYSLNHTAFVSCGATATGANIEWIDVVGSDQGSETFIMLYPGTEFEQDVTTVDLGNGTDNMTLEYGSYTFVDATTTIVDPASDDQFGLATAGNGTLVGDIDHGGTAELRVDNAENITMNGGAGNDKLDASGRNITSSDSGIASALDNVPDGPYSPVLQDLTLNGGTGDDRLFSGDGNDNFQGGPGVDSANYRGASGPVVIDLQAGTATGMGNDTLSDVQDAVGSRFGDTITGSSLDNTLSGRGGADTIDGAAGNDALNGDNGNDTLTGGLGDDVVHGWSGSDLMIAGGAGDGQDEYHGGYGLDTVDYSVRTGDNYLSNDSSPDSGEGNCPSGSSCEGDTISHWTETIIAGSGNDTLVDNDFGSQGTCAVTLVGGAGDDSLDGNGFCAVADYSGAPGPMTADLVAGTVTGDGSDTINDIHRFIGTDGPDTVLLDESSVLTCFWGGDGTDTVDGSQATGGLSIDLSNLSCNSASDVENAIGGAGDDELNGNSLYNTIVGNDGVDIITGQDGGDKLSGGAGNDEVLGGNGNDAIEGGLGDDTLDGGDGADTLLYNHAPHVAGHAKKGETIDNQLGFASGGDGQDSIGFFEIVKGSDFNDKIFAGQTFLDANSRLYGRGGKDQLTGSNSSDVLNGGSGNDNVHAGGGDDRVKGGSGKDVLYGSSGDDVLSGGPGHDTGWGGSGNDACHSIEERHSC